VFESNSSHKFDVNSFHHVDPHFGPRAAVDTTFVAREAPGNPKSWYLTSADRTFLALVKALHDSGMKVIVDVQFAHVSVDFWAFRDVLEKQERSQYASWFSVDEWDRPETPFASEFRYQSMWNIPAFPRLHSDSLGYAPALRSYLFASTQRWMDPNGDGDVSDGVDGWRVELADEIAPVFWDQWSELVRTINPSAIIVGEPITEPPPGKKRFDLVNSDVFGGAAVRMILNRRATPSHFEQELNAERGALEFSDITAQINWIDNEETDRLASMCVNRDNPYDAGGNPLKNPRYLIRKPLREERALQRLLVLLQFTYPGAPMIYYGDEAGMWGGSDPDCRKPMLWPDREFEAECSSIVNGDPARYPMAFDSSVYQYYHALLELRGRNIALHSGSSRVVLMDDRRLVFGFVRQSGANRVYVLMNFSDEAQDCRLSLSDVLEGTKIDAPLQHLTFYADRDGLTVTLPPRAGAVLIPRM
jgi:glycosidase